MAIRDIRSLDVAMLRTFDALMRERSVSRAAARLFLSQPAVSASLKRLRETFDDALFTRTAHGVLPTPRALALAPHVEQALIHVQRLLNIEREFDPSASDRILRLAGSDHSSRMLLPPLCRLLADRGSRIRLFWEAADYRALAERLNKGDVDLGLLPSRSVPSDVEFEMLYEDVYVVVARHGNPLFARGMSLDAFCLAPHAVLAQSRSGLDDAIDQALARNGRSRYAQVALTSFGEIAELLAATDHTAVFPRRVALRYAATLAEHPLPFELPSYRLYACWNLRSNEDPAVQWLRREIVRLGLAAGLAGEEAASAQVY